MADTKQLLRAHLIELRKQQTVILNSTEQLRMRREDMNQKIMALQVERDALTAQINAAQQPKLANLKAEISRVAQALGGPRLSDGA